MQRTVLFDMFATFSKKEMKEFGDFVSSPYFNTNENVIKLYEIIKKHFPDLAHPSLEKEQAFKKLFPGVKYNDSKMRLLIFGLCSLAEKFLQYEFIKSDKVKYNLDLLKILKNRNITRMYEKTSREAEKENEKLPKDEEYYLNRYEIEYDNLGFQIRNYADSTEKAVSKSDIQKTIDNLSYTYIIKIIKFYIYLFNLRSRFSIEYKMNFLDELKIHLERNNYENIPLIPIYYNILMMHLNEEDDIYYFTAKKLLFENEHRLDRSNILNLYINLENYCLRQTRRGNRPFDREMFELYQKELEQKTYFMEDNTMSPILYKNIIVSALRFKDAAWAEKFLEEYKNEIKSSIRHSTYTLCKAIIQYAQKNYPAALEHLARSQNENLLHKIEIKTLTIRIYYDSNQLEALIMYIDSFRHFINNNKLLSDYRRELLANFVRFVNSLVKLSFNRDTAEVNSVKKQVMKCGVLDHREWLLEKLEALSD